jgi:hypothetical protein
MFDGIALACWKDEQAKLSARHGRLIPAFPDAYKVEGACRHDVQREISGRKSNVAGPLSL